MILQKNSLDEMINSFPEVVELTSSELSNKKFDFYITALGFEERTLAIPEKLKEVTSFSCDELIYLQYGTSTTDNAFNEPRLKKALVEIQNSEGKKSIITGMFCDEEGFSKALFEKLNTKIQLKKRENINLILDISVFSSKLILTLFKIIFELKSINLLLVYTEAQKYFPLYEEFSQDPLKFISNESLSNTRGSETVVNSNEYSEGFKENPDLVVALACFKPDRIERIVSEIDESILINNDNRLIWLIGDPNFVSVEEKQKRKEMLRYINKIDSNPETIQYEVSTLDYKQTLIRLEAIYQESIKRFHFNIADLGSKMQTVAISIFYHIRPDVAVYYALPTHYNSNRYSMGIKNMWMIQFDDFNQFIKLINKIDEMKIFYKSNGARLVNDPSLEPQD